MSARVAVVTGGGGGIGAAIAEELGRQGAFVATFDPMVSVDGTQTVTSAEPTTADRIVAAGGQARALPVSVTDLAAVHGAFADLVAEFGAVDAVVNVAGISRPTSFARGSEGDWLGVLSVHLDGYRNILGAALPHMAAAGRGHVLGVTSGSGWRAADVGAYSCAKRAVAALTWQLGRVAPEGVVVNALSPIAATRMVTEALARAKPAAGGADRGGGTGPSTGGLALTGMPEAEALGPLGAHLLDADFSACRGQVVFTAGSEIAVVDEPRLIEVFRTEGAAAPAGLFERVTKALVKAEAAQASGGGSNARFDGLLAAGDRPPAPADVRRVAVMADDPAVAAAVTSALAARSVTVVPVAAASGFDACASALAAVEPGVDAVVVAPAGASPAGGGAAWERVLAEHDRIVDRIHTDAGWARAVADLARASGRPARLVTLTDATTAGGRSRAQASAQLARAALGATENRVAAFAVALESAGAGALGPAAELVAHLVSSPATVELSGAELAVGDGWFGLRSHPRPGASVAFGGSQLPPWFDDTLREIAR